MKVTLTGTQSNEGMELEEATSSSPVGTPVKQMGHEQNFDPKIILSTRNAGIGDGADCWNGQAKGDPSIYAPHGHAPDTINDTVNLQTGV